MQETPSDRGDQSPVQTPVHSARQTGRGRTRLLCMAVSYFPLGVLRSLEYGGDFQNGCSVVSPQNHHNTFVYNWKHSKEVCAGCSRRKAKQP